MKPSSPLVLGHWSLAISRNTSALLAALVLAILPHSACAITYADWIASYGLSGSSALETADPDLDGIVNLMEYALDTGSPIVGSSGNGALPKYGFALRTGDLLGEWHYTTVAPAANTVYHMAIQWRPRPGAEGVRYTPELCRELAAPQFWFSGRSAIFNQSLPGNIIQSTVLMQSQGFKRSFMRLRITQDATAGNGLQGVVTNGSEGTQALSVGTPAATPRATSGFSSSNLTTLDYAFTRTTGGTIITDFQWAWAPLTTNIEQVVLTRETSNPAIIIPDPANTQNWTAIAPGTATITLRTGSNYYSQSVTVLAPAAVNIDTPTGFVAGSLSAHLVAQIDPLLVGKSAAEALPIFTTQDHVAATYVRNTGCWAAPYVSALTAISPWNSQGGNQLAGILISPRHVLFATHYAAGVGAVMRFVKADNTVVERTITASQAMTITNGYYPDLTVGLLNSDVPAGIDYARVLPANWANYLPSLNTISLKPPALCLDQEEKALETDLSALNTTALFGQPTTALRSAFYEDKIGGDSSNPACLIVNGKLVVLTCWTYGGAGSGTSVVDKRAAVDALMTSLGGGYTTTAVDLSGFTSY
jgi:hypothetical protein